VLCCAVLRCAVLCCTPSPLLLFAALFASASFRLLTAHCFFPFSHCTALHTAHCTLHHTTLHTALCTASLCTAQRRTADGRTVNEVREIYRIQLPGNPIIGEGKPENQNHAIIFTRGEMIQAIDMNQAGYFEEALKMRNLLREFDVYVCLFPSHPSASACISSLCFCLCFCLPLPLPLPLRLSQGLLCFCWLSSKDNGRVATIVGFREHVYTGSLSSIANYMALQEGCFVTLGQRVLHSPLLIRLHYGHPDLFDKLFFMSRGGVSKASKAINLSEDIYAGFNNVLRGGHVTFREYIQVGKGRDVGLQQLFKFEAKLAQGAAMQSLSRDVYRMAFSLDFFRLLSFYYGMCKAQAQSKRQLSSSPMQHSHTQKELLV